VDISANNALHSALALPFAALNSLHSLRGNDVMTVVCSSVVAASRTWLINMLRTATPGPHHGHGHAPAPRPGRDLERWPQQPARAGG
jgi:hypothetical protein